MEIAQLQNKQSNVTGNIHHGSGNHFLDIFFSVFLAVWAVMFNSITDSHQDSLFTISKIAAITASCLSIFVSLTVIYDKYFKKK